MLSHRTIWIVEQGGGFVAMRDTGEIIESNKFKSTLEYILRKRAKDPAENIWAIACVVMPDKRQPNRKVSVKRHRPYT